MRCPTLHVLKGAITEILVLTMPQLMTRRLGLSNVKQYPITGACMLCTGRCSSHRKLDFCELGADIQRLSNDSRISSKGVLERRTSLEGF